MPPKKEKIKKLFPRDPNSSPPPGISEFLKIGDQLITEAAIDETQYDPQTEKIAANRLDLAMRENTPARLLETKKQRTDRYKKITR